MKPLILIILAMIGICASAQKKVAGCYLRMIEPVTSDTLVADNGVIKVNIFFDGDAHFASLNIHNLTDEVVEIDWDKFIIVQDNISYNIAFDDTVLALVDNPKGKSSIAPHTRIRKSVAPKGFAKYALKLFSKRDAPAQIGFYIPVVRNGETTYFPCTLEAYVQ